MFRNDFCEYADDSSTIFNEIFESSLEDDPSELAFSLFNEEFNLNALRVAISFKYFMTLLFFTAYVLKK